MRNEPTVTVIPATPGWRVCEPVQSEDGESVDEVVETDIIAWAVMVHQRSEFEISGYAEPVTADDGILRDNHALRTPGGKIFRPCEGTEYPDMDALLAEENRNREQEKAIARRIAEQGRAQG